MIDYTKAAIDKTISDLKRFAYFFNIAAQILSIAYLMYAIALNVGYLYANIVLCAITVIYTVFYIFAFRGNGNKEEREVVKRAFKWIKLGVKAFSLVVAVYGVYIATEHTTLVSIVLAALNVISWTLQVILTLTLTFVENRATLIVDAIRADIDNVKRPFEPVGNFIKKVKGEEIAPKEPPSKNRRYLDEVVLKYRQKREQKKAEEKARKRERKEAVKKAAAEEKEKVTK